MKSSVSTGRRDTGETGEEKAGRGTGTSPSRTTPTPTVLSDEPGQGRVDEVLTLTSLAL